MIKILKIIYFFLKKEMILITNNFQNKNKFKNHLDKKFDFYNKYLLSHESAEKILVTSFVNIFDYLKYEYLLGIYLSKIVKKDLLFLVNKNDYKSLNFFKKLGISNFIFFDNGNFIQRAKYLLEIFKILSKLKTIEEFVEFKYKDIEFGKIIYSHHARYFGLPTNDKIIADYFIHGVQFLNYYYQFENLFKKIKISDVIQSENQFMPNSVLFGLSLSRNIEVFSRTGINEITVKKVSEPKLFCESRQHVDSKIHQILKNSKNKDQMKKIANEILNLKFDGKLEADIDIDDELMKLIDYKKFNKINRKFFSKSELCELLSWDKNKPIGAILANDLTDALFTNKWRVYRDNYIWLKKSIQFASLNKEMNWLIKPHPSEIKNKVTLTTANLLKEFNCFENIKLCPPEVSLRCFPNILSLVLTNFGSAGYEYPALGVPAIISSDAMYSNMDVATEAKSEEEYKKLILQCPNIKPVDDNQKENALLFTYLLSVLTKITISTVVDKKNPYSLIQSEFWEQFEKSFKVFEEKNKRLIENDIFYRSFKYQIEKNLKHTLHLDEINKFQIKI
jgi:hypothetical protein